MSLQESDAAAAAVQKTPHRVTLAHLESQLAQNEFVNPSFAPEVTICITKTRNGFVVVGMSAPADPANFDAELGRRFAREDCLRQLWPLEGYLLRHQLASESLASAGERKTGITDLPDDQQRQLDNGEPIAPQPDPGAQPAGIDEGARGGAVDRGRADEGVQESSVDAPSGAPPEQQEPARTDPAPQGEQRFDTLQEGGAQSEPVTQADAVTHGGEGQDGPAGDAVGRPSDPPPRVDPAR